MSSWRNSVRERSLCREFPRMPATGSRQRDHAEIASATSDRAIPDHRHRDVEHDHQADPGDPALPLQQVAPSGWPRPPSAPPTAAGPAPAPRCGRLAAPATASTLSRLIDTSARMICVIAWRSVLRRAVVRRCVPVRPAQFAEHLPAHPEQQQPAGEQQADDRQQLQRDGAQRDADHRGADDAEQDGRALLLRPAGRRPPCRPRRHCRRRA